MSDRAYVQPGDRPRFVEGWFEVKAPEQADGASYLVIQSLCRILDLARQAVDQLGHSYRGYNVGSAVLANDEPGNRMGIYFGGNFTPHKGAAWNCAEKRALEAVQIKGFNRILALAVAGPAPELPSNIETLTLHPCAKCREMLGDSALTTSDTLVATSNLAEDAYELFTVQSLLRQHETGQLQPFPDYHQLLPFYWDQILTYDAESERADMDRLDKIAKSM